MAAIGAREHPFLPLSPGAQNSVPSFVSIPALFVGNNTNSWRTRRSFELTTRRLRWLPDQDAGVQNGPRQNPSNFFQFGLLRITGEPVQKASWGAHPVHHFPNGMAQSLGWHLAVKLHCSHSACSHWRQRWDPCSCQGSSSSASLLCERIFITSNRVSLEHLSSCLCLLQYSTGGIDKFLVGDLSYFSH